MAALISIIVPCYNQSQYLDECLQSILDQTFSNWQCIIINDGSPDNTKEIAENWAQKDSRFKYLLKENGGLSSARNAGIKYAEGEWILPLDADDKIESNYLFLAQKEFHKNFKVIYCNAKKFGAENGNWLLPDYSRKTLAVKNVIFCTAFFRKKDWEEASGYDTDLKYGWEDWEFWISILKNGGNVHKIKEVCFYYRIKENSMIKEMSSTDGKNKKLISHNIIYKKHIEFFTKELGDFQSLYEKIQDLSVKNNHLKTILSSRRYLYVNKFFNFFKI